MDAYESTIRDTARKAAPWYVVPADNKWFTRVIVAAAGIDLLGSLDFAYPKGSKTKLKELAAIKEKILRGSTEQGSPASPPSPGSADSRLEENKEESGD